MASDFDEPLEDFRDYMVMKLLLDTHVLIWFLEDAPPLGEAARSAIGSADHVKYVSLASAWEAAAKISLGTLRLPVPYEELFPGRLVMSLEMLAMNPAHFHVLLTIPWHYRDPSDRLLITQAQVEGPTRVIRNPHFASYGVPLLW